MDSNKFATVKVMEARANAINTLPPPHKKNHYCTAGKAFPAAEGMGRQLLSKQISDPLESAYPSLCILKHNWWSPDTFPHIGTTCWMGLDSEQEASERTGVEDTFHQQLLWMKGPVSWRSVSLLSHPGFGKSEEPQIPPWPCSTHREVFWIAGMSPWTLPLA